MKRNVNDGGFVVDDAPIAIVPAIVAVDLPAAIVGRRR